MNKDLIMDPFTIELFRNSYLNKNKNITMKNKCILFKEKNNNYDKHINTYLMELSNKYDIEYTVYNIDDDEDKKIIDGNLIEQIQDCKFIIGRNTITPWWSSLVIPKDSVTIGCNNEYKGDHLWHMFSNYIGITHYTIPLKPEDENIQIQKTKTALEKMISHHLIQPLEQETQ